MIISRPQTGTVISFTIFLIIAYTLSAFNLLAVINDPVPHWSNHLIVWLLLPSSLFITYKVLSRYKIVKMGNGQIMVRYPVLRKESTFTLKQVEHWSEVKIKTGKTSSYQELEIRFTEGRTIHLGQKEFTEYARLVSYLSQKVPKLKKATP